MGRGAYMLLYYVYFLLNPPIKLIHIVIQNFPWNFSNWQLGSVWSWIPYKRYIPNSTATHYPTWRTIIVGNTFALFYNHLRLSSPLVSSQVFHTSASWSPFHKLFWVSYFSIYRTQAASTTLTKTHTHTKRIVNYSHVFDS